MKFDQEDHLFDETLDRVIQRMNKYPVGPTLKIKFDFNMSFDNEGEFESYSLKLDFPVKIDDEIEFSIQNPSFIEE